MRKVIYFMLCLLMGINVTMAQTHEITGTVISAEDNEPVIGAAVIVKGTQSGTVTDIDGRYSFSVPSSAKILLVSYMGMKPQEVTIKNGQQIILEPDSKAIDEVVVTAMGLSREKKSLGYALQEVKSDDITKGGQMNLASSLSGKVAGVQITSQGGQIGASQNIVIRGNSSFGNNQPLVVVDGVPMTNDNATGSAVILGSGINDINPEDIESVSVLKGGSAALYGMRAGNGVILITTKSGKKKQGGVTVNYNGDFTVDRLYNLPSFQNKYGQGYYGSEFDWKESGDQGTYQEFALNKGYAYLDGYGNGVNDNADESWGPRLDIGLMLPQYNSPVVNGVRQATPWVSNPNNIKDFFETGYSTSHMISLMSSTEKSSTRASLSYRDQKGTTPNTDMKRYAASINTKMTFNRYLEFDMSANYVRTTSDNLPGTGYDGRNVMQSLLQWHGRQIDMKDLKANWNQRDEAGNYNHYNWQGEYAVNPYWVLNKNLNKYKRDRMFGKTSLWIKPTEWLKFEGRLGLDTYFSNQLSNVEWSVDYPNGYFRDYDRTTTEVNADFIAYFEKTFGEFQINGLAGANYRDYNYSINTIGADELTVPGVYTVANAKGSAIAEENHEKRRSNSVYANASVGWRNQAYVDISVRNDWDSTIKDAFFYPSFSGSWILSETFSDIKDSQWLNYLKIRGGWAKIGSATDPYLSNAYYSVLTAPFDGTTLYYNPIVFPALNLRPEMVKTWEVGVEANFFQNRLRVDAAYYQKTTTDQIMKADVSTSTGYKSMMINAGKISNKGAEIQIAGDIFSNKNGFTWTASLNWSKDKSKIIELYTDPNSGEALQAYKIGSSWSCTNYAKPGESWGTLVGTGYVYNEDGSILVKDGMPVSESNKNIGDVTPKWLAGFNNEFTYKNWSLGFLLDFRKGGDVYSISQAFGTYTGIYDFTAKGDIRENGVIAGQNTLTDKVFKNADGTINSTAVNAEDFFGNFYSICEMAVFDGSFLKLREAHITYTFPKSVLNKLRYVSAANVSLIGNNLALLWTHKSNLIHLDPESTTGANNDGVGFESNSYPPTRSIGVKLNLTF